MRIPPIFDLLLATAQAGNPDPGGGDGGDGGDGDGDGVGDGGDGGDGDDDGDGGGGGVPANDDPVGSIGPVEYGSESWGYDPTTGQRTEFVEFSTDPGSDDTGTSQGAGGGGSGQ